MSFSVGGDVNRDVTITFIGKDNASTAMRSISSSASKTTRTTELLTKSLKAAGLAAAGALAVGAALAAKALFDAVKAAYDDDLAMKKLAFTQMKAQDATKAQTDATADLIDKLELATGVADDEMRPAMAALAGTGMSVKKSQDLLGVALDVSVARGKSLQTVAEALGKAYNGQLTGLQRLGVKVTDASGDALKFSEVLAQLRERFGGAARAAGRTDPIKRLQAAYHQLQEEIGQQFLPILRQAMRFIINKVVPWVKEHLVPAVKRFSRWIADEGVPFIRDKLIPALQELYTVFNEQIKPVLEDTSRNARDLWKSLTKLWNTADEISQGSGGLEKALTGIKLGFMALFSPVNAILGVMRNLVDAFEWIINNAGRVLGAIGDVAGKAGEWIAKLPFAANGGWRGRAQGGWAMVGEHGPELINARGFVKTHSQSMGRGGGGNIYVTVNAVDGPGAGRAVQRVLSKYGRVTGNGQLRAG